jgi:transposase
MSEELSLFVGIDWAKDDHQVCILDPGGAVLKELVVEHTGAAISSFASQLADRAAGDPSRVAIGIEIPRGAIVEMLVERGFRVFALNPKQMDRFRDRHFPAGSKDDRRDAYVIADSLRTDLHCFREVALDDPLIAEIREYVCVVDELRDEANRLGNRLRDLLHRYYPQALQVCPAGDEPWFLEVLERAPTPKKARLLRRRTVDALLRTYRIRRLSTDDVLNGLRGPGFSLAKGTVKAASGHVRMLIPRLRLVQTQRSQARKELAALLDQLGNPEADSPQEGEHRDVEIILSLPGVGTIVAATMLAEAPRPLADRDYHAMRAHSGIAPITQASGKKTKKRARVLMRRACNGRLRNALYHWARVAVQRDDAAKAHYAALRAKGHSYGRALRTVADRLLRILFAMLRNRSLYSPNHRRALPPPVMEEV